MIVNIKTTNENYFYIGRKNDGSMHFGNPFSHLSYAAAIRVSTRNEAVDRCESWLRGTTDTDVEPERRQWILDNLEQLRDQVLGCFCNVPQQKCHGQVYEKLLAEKVVTQ